jgi:peroxiredoxin
MLRSGDVLGMIAWTLLLAGCGAGLSIPGFQSATESGYDDYANEFIHFKDQATANADPGATLLDLVFLDQEGKKISPKDYLGKKNLVLVMTRGYAGSVCPYCSTYTSSLITNYSAIAARDAEVIVVYPIERQDQSGRLGEFLKITFKRSSPSPTKMPFPVVLDVQLKAVDALGIRRNLSKPATYILDKTGHVRFAYVGNALSDRPSIKVILQQLDAIKQEPS